MHKYDSYGLRAEALHTLRQCLDLPRHHWVMPTPSVVRVQWLIKELLAMNHAHRAIAIADRNSACFLSETVLTYIVAQLRAWLELVLEDPNYLDEKLLLRVGNAIRIF